LRLSVPTEPPPLRVDYFIGLRLLRLLYLVRLACASASLQRTGGASEEAKLQCLSAAEITHAGSADDVNRCNVI
jgi:hypothetical protein